MQPVWLLTRMVLGCTKAEAGPCAWCVAPIEDVIAAARGGGIVVALFSTGLFIAAARAHVQGLEQALRHRRDEVEAELARSRPTDQEARAWFALQSACRTPMP